MIKWGLLLGPPEHQCTHKADHCCMNIFPQADCCDGASS